MASTVINTPQRLETGQPESTHHFALPKANLLIRDSMSSDDSVSTIMSPGLNKFFRAAETHLDVLITDYSL